MFRNLTLLGLAACLLLGSAQAQLVILPAPRLLTLMPMGGQAGTSVDVTWTGENLEQVSALKFSTDQITAKPINENQFRVTIAPGTPPGIYDARVVSRLGISSPRAFSVGALKEITRTDPNTSLETAMPLTAGSICNAVMTKKAIDYYAFDAKKGQRYVIECAAVGIDSKLTPVLILADADGNDLQVNRTGGIIDFTPTVDGRHHLKINDLTYQGSNRHFYRLALQTVSIDAPAPRQPATATVSSMSWPPPAAEPTPATQEAEPNDLAEAAEAVSLPLDIQGSFYPAADVDTYDFTAKKGETWWIEVASERLGLSTDPFVLVQRVAENGTLEDVAELYDIDSPVKVSTNGYSYDGPPYNAGSPDVLGSFEVKEDGNYRIQVRDLFGGTRNEPDNVYRLIIRKAQPGFTLSGWALHMTLRNGDRAAFSKPIALRAGGAMTIEVIAVRRDGYDGEIQLTMEDLPKGITATGLSVPAEKSVGHVVIHAAEDAPVGLSMATLFGHATIDGKEFTQPCHLATMEWPVKDAKQEIPEPRLVSNIPVSVSNSELAPLSIAAAEDKVWETTEGETLRIPLTATWRGEFSGTSVKMRAHGGGFEGVKNLDFPLKAETHEVELDLAKLKVPPGDYEIAFYGGVVSKYRYNPDAVAAAEAAQKEAEAEAAMTAEEAKKLADTDPEAAKRAAKKEADAKARMAAAEKKMKAVTKAAEPKDIVDIVVSKPIRISVKAKPKEVAKK